MASLYVDVVNNNIEACMKAACMRAGMAQDVVPKALEFQVELIVWFIARILILFGFPQMIVSKEELRP